MHLDFSVDLGEIDISVDSNTGRIESCVVGKYDYIDGLTVEQFIIACLGGPTKFAKLISEKTIEHQDDQK